MNITTMKIALTLLLGVFLNTNSYAAPDVGSGFSYQGQLLDAGEPTNLNHDIRILAFEAELPGDTDLGDEEFLNVTVENGLFTIPVVDFGPGIYLGKEVWLEIRVRKSGSGIYQTLSPRQRLSAVPYAVQAEFLASNGASNNDVLQFDGSNWVPQALTGVGKWQTHSSDPSSINYITGKVGIGTVYPSSRLNVIAPTGETPLTVQSGVGGTSIKLKVNTNGGLSVGTNTAAPADGLLVKGNTKIEGTTTLEGDTKQPLNSNGMVKYMIEAFCAGSSSYIKKSYNGVNSSSVIIDTPSGNPAGQCIFNFPFDISNRYWQVSAVNFTTQSRAASCNIHNEASSLLYCKVSKTNTGSDINSSIMLLIY